MAALDRLWDDGPVPREPGERVLPLLPVSPRIPKGAHHLAGDLDRADTRVRGWDGYEHESWRVAGERDRLLYGSEESTRVGWSDEGKAA